MKAFMLTDEDAKILEALISRVKNSPKSLGLQQDYASEIEQPFPGGSHVVYLPAGGIPASTVSTGTGTQETDAPNVMDCDVYEPVDLGGGVYDYAYAGFQVQVANFTLETIPGDRMAAVVKDKYDDVWYPFYPPGAGVDAGGDGGGGSGTSLTVRTVEEVSPGNPVLSVPSVGVILANETSGLDLSDSAGRAALALFAATASQQGAVSTGTQTFAGAKTFTGMVTLDGGATFPFGDTALFRGFVSSFFSEILQVGSDTSSTALRLTSYNPESGGDTDYESVTLELNPNAGVAKLTAGTVVGGSPANADSAFAVVDSSGTTRKGAYVTTGGLTFCGGLYISGTFSGGFGTVTSVGLSMPSIFSVSGSPVTTSGTLTASLNTQSANVVFAGPTSGGSATPTFRALVAADLGTGTADNTKYLRGDLTWQTYSAGGGTVTSVALALPSIFSVSGSPVTTSGTLTGSLANQNANLVFAGPSSGSAAAPTFRSLVRADIPNGPIATITADTTLTATDDTILCNNSSNITITLPAASTVTGKRYTIKKTSNNNNTVTIDADGSETIDGATTIVLYMRYDGLVIQTEGANWFIVEDARRPHVAKMTCALGTSINDVTDTQINFDAVDYDNAGIADASTNQFTIKRTGRYIVSGMGQHGDSPTVHIWSIFINGTGTARTVQTDATAGFSACFPVNDVIHLAAGDTVRLYGYQDNAANTAQTTNTAAVQQPRLSVTEIRGGHV